MGWCHFGRFPAVGSAPHSFRTSLLILPSPVSSPRYAYHRLLTPFRILADTYDSKEITESVYEVIQSCTKFEPTLRTPSAKELNLVDLPQ